MSIVIIIIRTYTSIHCISMQSIHRLLTENPHGAIEVALVGKLLMDPFGRLCSRLPLRF